MTKNNMLNMLILVIMFSLHLTLVAGDVFADHYAYDSLNRLTQVVYDGGFSINYFYDAAGNIIQINRVGSLLPVNGLCGSSSGSLLEAAPTSNLCSTGTPSTIGAWNWDCQGLNGGDQANCSAILGYLLSVNVSGSGNVQSSSIVAGVPSDILCSSGTCSAKYPSGILVNLVALPGQTSIFGNWSGDCASTPCVVTMNAAKNISATFNQASLAKNNTTGTTYSTLVDAINSASSITPEELMLIGTPYYESISFNKAIILNGGWNPTFLVKGDAATTLYGSLTIIKGDSKAETIVVKEKLSVQGGSLRVKDVVVRP